MQPTSDHLYFVFDSQFSNADLYPEAELYIEQWSVGLTNPQDDNAMTALSSWANHSFISEPARDTQDNDEFDESLIGVYSKAHNSSMALRTANATLYAIGGQGLSEAVVGYHVTLPEHLSTRQQSWLDLFEPPQLQNVITVTLDEYLLLKHLKVLSTAHPISPITLYSLPSNPLSNEINQALEGTPPSMAAVSPATAREVVSLRTQFLQKIKNAIPSEDSLYDIQAAANRHLLIRAERLNQIKVLIYADYYVSPSRYLSDTHKIGPYWIQKRAISNENELTYKEHGVDGWFRSEYTPNTLLVALTALACAGYWSVECDGDNPTELLTTACEGFLHAHQSDDLSNRRLYQIIYHPQNPFDLKKDLSEFNSLMPVLAAICQKPTSKGRDMAIFFDDKESTKSLIDVLLTNAGRKPVIEKFIDAMSTNR